MKEAKILFVMEKQDTGSIVVRSSALVTDEQADKLNWIFQNFSGKREDFQIFMDEYQTERGPLSHVISYCSPLNAAEVSILRRLGFERTGIVDPLDLLEEFEAHRGGVQYSDDDEKFHLEGEGEILDPEDEDTDPPLGSIVI